MKLNFLEKIKKTLPKKSKKAFSLNDLAILMSTVAIVAVSSVAISNIQLSGEREKADSEKIETIYKAIGKYLVQKKRLPCPASTTKIRGQDLSYGVESISAGNCAVTDGVYYVSSLSSNLIYGIIPAQTLGLSSDFAQDQYGSKIVYVVDKRATYPPESVNENIGSIQNGSIIVKENAIDISTDSIFIILTVGKNKLGGFNYNSPTYNGLPQSLNEQENSFTGIVSNVINMNNIFVKSVKNDDVFDDNLLFKNRQSLIDDFKADFLIPCQNAGVKYGSQNAVFGQIIYALSSCPPPSQNIIPAKKCSRDGRWIYEKSCPCYISAEGIDNPVYVSNGIGSISCKAAGFDGTLKYNCDEEFNLTITEGCKRNCEFSAIGFTKELIPNGVYKVDCNQKNYKGGYVVTCNNGVASSIGGCSDSRCSIGGYSGMMSQTVDSDTSGIYKICETGYSGSYSYTCFEGVSSVNDLCFKDCSFSAPGISSRILNHGNYEISCGQGYIGGKVLLSCNDGVVNVKSGSCYEDGKCSVGIGLGMSPKSVSYGTNLSNDGTCITGYEGSYSYSCSTRGEGVTVNNCVPSQCTVGNGEGMVVKNVSKGSAGEDGICSPGYGGFYKWSCSSDGFGKVIENNCTKFCKVGLSSQGEGMTETIVGFDKEGDQGLCDKSRDYIGTYSWSCKVNPTTKKVEGLVTSNNCKNYCLVGTSTQGLGMVQKRVVIGTSGIDGTCNNSSGYVGSYSWDCDSSGYGSVSSNKCVNYCLVGTSSQGVGMVQKQVNLGVSASDGVCDASIGYTGTYSWSCSSQGVANITQNNCVLKTCSVGGSSGMVQKVVNAGTSKANEVCDNGYRGTFSWSCTLKGVGSTVNNCTKIKCQVPSSTYPNLITDLVDFNTSTQTLACKNGFVGNLSYTCSDAGGAFGVLAVSSYSPCVAITCPISNVAGFVSSTVIPYSTTSQSYYCNDPIYNNFNTATFPACDSAKTLTATSNGCNKISCTIPAGNASNVTPTSIFVGSNQNLTCASGYSSGTQVTASCSAVNATRPADGLSVPQTGNYTINGTCAPIKCTINNVAGFVDNTIVSYSTTSQSYYCNDPIYNNFNTATFPACDSTKTLTATSNGCNKISCSIPSGNSSNVTPTSIFIGSNQNLTCASGYSSGTQITASCSAVNATRPADGLSVPQTGNYTTSGSCQINCPISLTGISQTSIPFGANTLTCGNGYTGTLNYNCGSSVCNSFVTVYRDFNYSGVSVNYSPGSYDYPLSLGNDVMSSAKIPNGLQLTLFQDALNSSSRVLTSDTPVFNVLTFASGANLNDNVSALTVVKLADCVPSPVLTSTGAQSTCNPITCSIPAGINGFNSGTIIPFGTNQVFNCNAVGFSTNSTATFSCGANGTSTTGIFSQVSNSCLPISCIAADVVGATYNNKITVNPGETEFAYYNGNLNIDNRIFGSNKFAIVNRIKFYDVYEGPMKLVLQRSSWTVYSSNGITYNKFPSSANAQYFRVGSDGWYFFRSSFVFSSDKALDYGTTSFNCDNGYAGSLSYNCAINGSTVTPSGGCTPITCNIPTTANTTIDGTQVNYKASATPLTCKTGFSGSPTYTCTGSTNPGTYSQSGTCNPTTCSAPAANGYLIKNSLAYSTGSGTIACDQTGYSGSVNYTCTTSGPATVSGVCSCATGYIKDATGACINKCTIPATASTSQVITNSLNVSGNGTCAAGYTGYFSYNCSPTGVVTITLNNCYEGTFTEKLYTYTTSSQNVSGSPGTGYGLTWPDILTLNLPSDYLFTSRVQMINGFYYSCGSYGTYHNAWISKTSGFGNTGGIIGGYCEPQPGYYNTSCNAGPQTMNPGIDLKNGDTIRFSTSNYTGCGYSNAYFTLNLYYMAKKPSITIGL